MMPGNSLRPLILLPVITLVISLFILIGYILLSLPLHMPGLSETVSNNLPESGVKAPVTAVLLNFRGYDTLLELAVLLAALLGAWHLGTYQVIFRNMPSSPILDGMVSYLTPVILLITGYVLWLGGHSAGGAFQAGAVLAGAGVLLFVSRPDLVKIHDDLKLRVMLVIGPALFTLIAGILLGINGSLLEYDPRYAGMLILIIEAASVVSIGLSLTLLFAGGRPQAGGKS